jgi:hypothetical protein
MRRESVISLAAQHEDPTASDRLKKDRLEFNLI